MTLSDYNYKAFFWRLYEKLFEEDIFSSAAQVGFYFSFAIFPLFLFLITLVGMVLGSVDDLRNELFFYLSQVMPYSAFDLVKKTIIEVTQDSTGGKLTLGIFIAIYSASAGIDSIRIALNSVWGIKENRSYIRTKLQSILLTIVIAILIFVALGIVFYGWQLISLALNYLGLPDASPVILVLIQWITVLSALMLVFAIIYNFCPDHVPFKWIWITPGSVTGIILWLILSSAFKTYLNYYNTYNKMYGSLGAVIILMLWLYLTALVILFGGLINATLQEMTDGTIAEKSEELTQEEIKADEDVTIISDDVLENKVSADSETAQENPDQKEEKTI